MDNNQEMLIRIDEKLTALNTLVASNNDRSAKEIKELWEEIEALRVKINTLVEMNIENSFSAKIGRTILFLVSSVGLGVLINKIFNG